MDYYVTSKTTIGFVVSGFRNKETDRSGSNIQLLNPSYAIDSLVYSPNTNNTSWKNGSANLNFRHTYDSSGRELSADWTMCVILRSATSISTTTYSPG
jgi:iron complex outermembrane receptor protein